MISPAQCRAARGLLGWTQQDLQSAAGVGLSTIRGFESGQRSPIAANLTVLRGALETAGVEFIDADNGGPGVRLAG